MHLIRVAERNERVNMLEIPATSRLKYLGSESPYLLISAPNQLLVFFFCMLALCIQNAWANADRLQLYHHIAEGNYMIGDLAGAERGIEQMLRLDESYAPALALKARVLMEQQETERALDTSRQASRSAPQNLEYQLLEALILGHLGKRGDALKKIDSVIALATPGGEDALVAQQLKGLIEMAEGNWEEAAEVFKAMSRTTHKQSESSRRLASEAYLEKAKDHLKNGNGAAAILSIDQAITLYEKVSGTEALQAKTSLKLLRARTLVRIGKPKEAISGLRQLLAGSPENLEVITTLASIYARTGDWDSLDELVEPLAAQPELIDVTLYLEGRIALARDRVGTARKKFEEAIELQKNKETGLLPSLLFYRGLCLQRLDRKEQATAAMEEAMKKGFQPETADEAVVLAKMLLRAGKAELAIPILEKNLLSTEKDPKFANAWSVLGRAHEKAGNTSLAISALNESLSLQTNQSVSLALRGSLLRQIGDLEGALADYENASALDPSNKSLLYALSLTYLQLGQLQYAEQKLGQAVQSSPQQRGQVLLHSLLAYASGKSSTAAFSLEKYFELATEETNSSAHYLNYLLHADAKGLNDPVIDYLKGKASRKEVLDWAGRAETPEFARSRICSAAYWLAQKEHLHGANVLRDELLKIALETGTPENPEWQFARWHSKEVERNN